MNMIQISWLIHQTYPDKCYPYHIQLIRTDKNKIIRVNQAVLVKKRQ